MPVYALLYASAWLFSAGRYPVAAGLCLLSGGIYLYVRDYRKSGEILHLRGIFSLSFAGGQGIACFALSRLAVPWKALTWISLFFACAGFHAAFDLCERLFGDAGTEAKKNSARRPVSRKTAEVLWLFTLGLAAVSLAAFLAEASALGFVPLFLRNVPHAYSSFHLRGVHYFTTSCVLVPSLALLTLLTDRAGNGFRQAVMGLAAAVSLAIPVLCVSRFQLLFAVILAVFTWLLTDNRLGLPALFAGGAALAGLYVLLTIARGHSAEYLNTIFEMKNPGIPVFISQPYTYIANNYENFNFLVSRLPRHTYGLRTLTPLWTLTGLKFFFPGLMSSPLYVVKEELTTLTLFYDAYYDFGAAGVLIFSGLLGAVSYFLMRGKAEARNPVFPLIYAQFAIPLALSFFTTWFSNPATWFYLAVTVLAAIAAELSARSISFFGGKGK